MALALQVADVWSLIVRHCCSFSTLASLARLHPTLREHVSFVEFIRFSPPTTLAAVIERMLLYAHHCERNGRPISIYVPENTEVESLDWRFVPSSTVTVLLSLLIVYNTRAARGLLRLGCLQSIKRCPLDICDSLMHMSALSYHPHIDSDIASIFDVLTSTGVGRIGAMQILCRCAPLAVSSQFIHYVAVSFPKSTWGTRPIMRFNIQAMAEADAEAEAEAAEDGEEASEQYKRQVAKRLKSLISLLPRQPQHQSDLRDFIASNEWNDGGAWFCSVALLDWLVNAGLFNTEVLWGIGLLSGKTPPAWIAHELSESALARLPYRAVQWAASFLTTVRAVLWYRRIAFRWDRSGDCRQLFAVLECRKEAAGLVNCVTVYFLLLRFLPADIAQCLAIEGLASRDVYARPDDTPWSLADLKSVAEHVVLFSAFFDYFSNRFSDDHVVDVPGTSVRLGRLRHKVVTCLITISGLLAENDCAWARSLLTHLRFDVIYVPRTQVERLLGPVLVEPVVREIGSLIRLQMRYVVHYHNVDCEYGENSWFPTPPSVAPIRTLFIEGFTVRCAYSHMANLLRRQGISSLSWVADKLDDILEWTHWTLTTFRLLLDYVFSDGRSAVEVEREFYLFANALLCRCIDGSEYEFTELLVGRCRSVVCHQSSTDVPAKLLLQLAGRGVFKYKVFACFAWHFGTSYAQAQAMLLPYCMHTEQRAAALYALFSVYAKRLSHSVRNALVWTIAPDFLKFRKRSVLRFMYKNGLLVRTESHAREWAAPIGAAQSLDICRALWARYAWQVLPDPAYQCFCECLTCVADAAVAVAIVDATAAAMTAATSGSHNQICTLVAALRSIQ